MATLVIVDPPGRLTFKSILKDIIISLADLKDNHLRNAAITDKYTHKLSYEEKELVKLRDYCIEQGTYTSNVGPYPRKDTITIGNKEIKNKSSVADYFYYFSNGVISGLLIYLVVIIFGLS